MAFLQIYRKIHCIQVVSEISSYTEIYLNRVATHRRDGFSTISDVVVVPLAGARTCTLACQ